MGHLKGERHNDFDRLHYPDGTHRGSPRSANGSEVGWFDQHHRTHLAKHREQGEVPKVEELEAEETEPVRYVWVIRDLDSVTPQIGTLAEYAKVREMSQLSGDYQVSSRVWLWGMNGKPVEHTVEIERTPATENGYIPIEYRVNGETVIHMVDGQA